MPENNKKQRLSVTDFTPMEAGAPQRRLPVSPSLLALIILAASAVVIMLYLFVARAVIFQASPQDAEIEISGLSFNIGDNYLLLKGDYDIVASAEGYYPLTQSIVVSDQATQELKLKLQPLPGNLLVTSEIEDIQVNIDG